MPEADLRFSLRRTDSATAARRGALVLSHGAVETPVFMPVGTQGTVKGVLPEQLEELGAQIILGNTYHLLLRPGPDLVAAHGGLHGFMNWSRPILTDSGGFQVFSLEGLRKLDEEGVTFRSVVDGALVRLTPERAMAVQQALGSDIAMVLDVCPPANGPLPRIVEAVNLSTRWAARCLDAHRNRPRPQALFGIVQGGTDPELRTAHARALRELPFDGFAVGGLSVGESAAEMYSTLDVVMPELPVDRPRYLMGVGTPENLVEAVARGVDMFDCVLPTRTARTGRLFTRQGHINILNAEHAISLDPIDPGCSCYACRHYTRSYLRHLHQTKEILASVLGTLHNLHYYLDLMRRMRDALDAGRFAAFREEFYQGRDRIAPEESK